MRYITILLTLLVALVIANFVEAEEADDHGGTVEVAAVETTADPTPTLRVRSHALRKHHKRGYPVGMQCASSKTICPPDSVIIYYRCCRYETGQCCWYIRIWVIVVFGALLLKAVLACFVSFFRCVCC